MVKTLVLNSLITSAESAFHQELQNEQPLGFSINTNVLMRNVFWPGYRVSQGLKHTALSTRLLFRFQLLFLLRLESLRCVPWGQVGEGAGFLSA